VKDDRVYLLHIRDAIERIQIFTTGGREQFLSSAMIQDAVLRNLEVIGEAVKGLSDGLRTSAPDVPWKQIAGMRDVLIHHYFGVKLETVWQVVAEHVPALKTQVDELLENDPNLPTG
jgi:uncharacterized protein with HEPN domain